MSLKINGFALNKSNGFYVLNININTKKDIRTEDLKYRHGIKIDRFAYFDGLEITISGESNCQPYIKNSLLSRISYGLIKLEFDDGFYICETKKINFKQISEKPNFETFELVFISPAPYKYENEKISFTKYVDNTVSIFYDNDNIKNILTDINFKFSGSNTIILKNYQIFAIENDTTNTTTITTQNTLLGFDYNKSSIVAKFPRQVYINRFYMLFDEVASYTIKKGEIQIFYKKDTEFLPIPNDFSIKIISASEIGKDGEMIVFEDINVECIELKVHYNGENTSPDFKYNNEITKINDAIIVPELYSYCKNENNTTIFMNGQLGLILENGVKNLTAIKGQFLRLFPKTTYCYALQPTNIEVSFVNYNFYEVEHV